MKFFLVAFAIFLWASLSVAKGDTCIDCHRQLKASSYMGHNFLDWEKSIHAAKGVGCAACHGGDPSTSDPVKAHQGVLSSRNKNSKVHFQKVALTCGQCHIEEFKEFQKSVHYSMLQNTGRGPNCLTCHGTMATTILKYSDMDKTCSLCHGKPTQAARVLSLMDSSKRSLKLYREQLTKWKDKAPERYVKLEKEFAERYLLLQRKWHSFDVAKMTGMLETFIKNLNNAEKELKRESPSKEEKP